MCQRRVVVARLRGRSNPSDVYAHWSDVGAGSLKRLVTTYEEGPANSAVERTVTAKFAVLPLTAIAVGRPRSR